MRKQLMTLKALAEQTLWIAAGRFIRTGDVRTETGMTSTQHPSTDGADRAAQQPSRQGDGKFETAGLRHRGGTPLLRDLLHSWRPAFQLRSAAPPDQLAHVRPGRVGAKRQLPAHRHRHTGRRWRFSHRFAHWAVAVRCPSCSWRSGLGSSAQACSPGSVERISARHTTNCRPPLRPPVRCTTCARPRCSRRCLPPASCWLVASPRTDDVLGGPSAISGALMVIFFVLSGVAFAQGSAPADPDRGPLAARPSPLVSLIAAIGWRFIRSRRVQALPSARALSPRSS